ncbi:MAG: hypothetical protein Q9198_002926 [Flavoplaca austrocitrina]
MSFGYSVGDFILLGQLAWTVFKSCKGAPESFADISYEVLSLHAVIKEFGDNLKEENPAPSQLAGLRHVAGGCQRVLDDLKVLTDRYRSLGSQNKRIRDRFKWGGEDIAGIRLRLTLNTALLNAFIRWVLTTGCYTTCPWYLPNHGPEAAAAIPEPTSAERQGRFGDLESIPFIRGFQDMA